VKIFKDLATRMIDSWNRSSQIVELEATLEKQCIGLDEMQCGGSCCSACQGSPIADKNRAVIYRKLREIRANA